MLTNPLVLAGVAVLLPLLAPLLLARSTWQLTYPRLALGAWLAAFLGGFGVSAYLLGVVVARAIAANPAGPPVRSVIFTLGAWGMLGAAGAAASLIWSRAEPLASSQHRDLRLVAPLATARHARGRFTIVTFDSPEPTAHTGSPLSREVYISRGLREALPAAKVEAIIEHELVHLRQWHGPIVRLAEINSACLPKRLRAGREFKRAALLLVELIADDAAARRVGPARYANTLLAMGEATGDAVFELRARRLEHRDWRPSSLATAWRLLRAH